MNFIIIAKYITFIVLIFYSGSHSYYKLIIKFYRNKLIS
jgi:hypothetical protein